MEILGGVIASGAGPVGLMATLGPRRDRAKQLAIVGQSGWRAFMAQATSGSCV